MNKARYLALPLLLISSFSYSTNIYFGYGKSTAATAPKIKNFGLGYDFEQTISILGIENLTPVLEANYWTWDNYDGDIKGGSISPGLKLPLQYPLNPYIKLSVGVSYIERTKWYARKLGDNWLFEDKLELGLELNPNNIIAFNLVHYSNAGLNKHNSGANVVSLVYKLNW